MKPLPHHYHVSLKWEDDRSGTLSVKSRPALPGGPPPEFDGPQDRWSPEHLLLGAVDLCLMTTFMALTKKGRLDVKRYRSSISGTLDRKSSGFVFTEITQKVFLEVEGRDVERARRMLETAKKYCLIANALKPDIRLEANVCSRITEEVV